MFMVNKGIIIFKKTRFNLKNKKYSKAYECLKNPKMTLEKD